jgi:very-short-patch-repair endonuclease
VEVDGPFHDPAADAVRDAFLRKQGFRILRVPASRLQWKPELVLAEIESHLPPPPPIDETRRDLRDRD